MSIPKALQHMHCACFRIYGCGPNSAGHSVHQTVLAACCDDSPWQKVKYRGAAYCIGCVCMPQGAKIETYGTPEVTTRSLAEEAEVLSWYQNGP